MERQSRRHGLSTFLAHHEDCGGGFDIQRRGARPDRSFGSFAGVAGSRSSTRLRRMKSLPPDQPVSRSAPRQRAGRGPGATVAAQSSTEDRGARGRPERSRPSGAGTVGGDDDKRPGDRSGALSFSWRSWLPGLIAGLIGGALVLIVLAIASDDGNSGGSKSSGGPAGSGATSAPTVHRTHAHRIDTRGPAAIEAAATCNQARSATAGRPGLDRCSDGLECRGQRRSRDGAGRER